MDSPRSRGSFPPNFQTSTSNPISTDHQNHGQEQTNSQQEQEHSRLSSAAAEAHITPHESAVTPHDTPQAPHTPPSTQGQKNQTESLKQFAATSARRVSTCITEKKEGIASFFKTTSTNFKDRKENDERLSNAKRLLPELEKDFKTAQNELVKAIKSNETKAVRDKKLETMLEAKKTRDGMEQYIREKEDFDQKNPTLRENLESSSKSFLQNVKNSIENKFQDIQQRKDIDKQLSQARQDLDSKRELLEVERDLFTWIMEKKELFGLTSDGKEEQENIQKLRSEIDSLETTITQLESSAKNLPTLKENLESSSKSILSKTKDALDNKSSDVKKSFSDAKQELTFVAEKLNIKEPFDSEVKKLKSEVKKLEKEYKENAIASDGIRNLYDGDKLLAHPLFTDEDRQIGANALKIQENETTKISNQLKAKKQELENLLNIQAETRLEIKDLKKVTAEVKDELKGEYKEVKGYVKGDPEVKAKIETLQAELNSLQTTLTNSIATQQKMRETGKSLNASQLEDLKQLKANDKETDKKIKDIETQLKSLVDEAQTGFKKDKKELKENLEKTATTLKDAVVESFHEIEHYTGIEKMQRPPSKNDTLLESAENQLIQLQNEVRAAQTHLEFTKITDEQLNFLKEKNTQIADLEKQISSFEQTKLQEDSSFKTEHSTMKRDTLKIADISKSVTHAAAKKTIVAYSGTKHLIEASGSRVVKETKALKAATKADKKESPALEPPVILHDTQASFDDLKKTLQAGNGSPSKIISLSNAVKSDAEFFQQLSESDRTLIDTTWTNIDKSSFNQMLGDLTKLGEDKNKNHSLQVLALCNELQSENMKGFLNESDKAQIDTLKSKAEKDLGITADNPKGAVNAFIAGRALDLNPGNLMGSLTDVFTGNGLYTMSLLESRRSQMDQKTGVSTPLTKKEYDEITEKQAELRLLEDAAKPSLTSDGKLTDVQTKRLDTLREEVSHITLVTNKIPVGAFEAANTVLTNPDFPIKGKLDVVKAVQAWSADSKHPSMTRNKELIGLAENIADNALKSNNPFLAQEGKKLKEALVGSDGLGGLKAESSKPLVETSISHLATARKFEDVVSSAREGNYSSKDVEEMARAIHIRNLHTWSEHDTADAIPGAQGSTNIKLGSLSTSNLNMIAESILMNNNTLASPKEVENMMRFYLDVAKAAAKNGDFETASTIDASLSQAHFSRIINNKEFFSSKKKHNKIQQDFNELQTSMALGRSSDKASRENYKEAHNNYQKMGGLPPTMPVQILLKDNTFSVEGNPDFNETSVNSHKFFLTQTNLNKMETITLEAKAIIDGTNKPQSPVILPEMNANSRESEFYKLSLEIMPKK